MPGTRRSISYGARFTSTGNSPRFLSLIHILSKDLSVEAALAEAKLKLTNEMLHMYSIQNAMLAFILIVTAVVLAASGFSYLHSKKKTDFFHSLPISREMLYTVTCLDGILYLAVPYLVFLLAAGVMPVSYTHLFLCIHFQSL